MICIKNLLAKKNHKSQIHNSILNNVYEVKNLKKAKKQLELAYQIHNLYRGTEIIS